MMGKEQYVREMWEYFAKKEQELKRFREEVEEEKASRNTRSVTARIASQRVLGQPESTWSKLEAAMTLIARID